MMDHINSLIRQTISIYVKIVNGKKGAYGEQIL